MFTLLIADDEFYTRQGILKTINLEKYSIDKVIEADDGETALKNIENDIPDIALLDVRMPRMDGIQLAFRIKSKYPGCVIVFVSAYSDKEYLRSAISLGALGYVDKPINDAELNMAICNAVNLCRESKKKEIEERNRCSSELCRLFMRGHNNLAEISDKMDMVKIAYGKLGEAVTFIVRLLFEDDADCDFKLLVDNKTLNAIDNILGKHHFSYVRACINEQTLVAHLFLPHPMSSTEQLMPALKELSDHVKNCSFFISVGMPVDNFQDICISYAAAQKGLQQNFYIGVNSVAFHKNTEISGSILLEDVLERFEECIWHNDQKHAEEIIKKLTNDYKNSKAAPIGTVKEDYYHLINKLLLLSENRRIDLFSQLDLKLHLWKIIADINTIQELEGLLLNLLEAYFSIIGEKKGISTAVLAIEEYINCHFDDPDLSINKISEKLNLSSNYLCLIFKQEKNITINQYITQYRVEKAKKYLKDISLKINNIALKTGYRDNNYFAKIFKKQTGMSPREYREEI